MPKGWMPTKRHSDTSWTLHRRAEEHTHALGAPPACMAAAAAAPPAPAAGVMCHVPPLPCPPPASPLQIVQRQLIIEQLGEAQQL